MKSTKPASQYADPGEQAIYCFGEFQLDLRRIELRRRGRALVLTPKSMDVLVYLVENHGRPVSREELLAALWPNTRVANGSLRQAIWEIRRVLSEPSGSDFTIETLHGRGYRFNAQVTRFSPPYAPAAAVEPLGKRATTDGARVRAVTDALTQRLQLLPSDMRSMVLELAQLLAARPELEVALHAPASSQHSEGAVRNIGD